VPLTPHGELATGVHPHFHHLIAIDPSSIETDEHHQPVNHWE